MGYRSPRLITQPIITGTAVDPLDGETRYCGCWTSLSLTVTAQVRKIYVPVDCILRKARITLYSTTATGTDEDIECYFRKNNTTDTLIQTRGEAAVYRIFTNDSLNISLTAGDFYEIKFVFPTWVTNPTGVLILGILIFETA